MYVIYAHLKFLHSFNTLTRINYFTLLIFFQKTVSTDTERTPQLIKYFDSDKLFYFTNFLPENSINKYRKDASMLHRSRLREKQSTWKTPMVSHGTKFEIVPTAEYRTTARAVSGNR